MPNIEKQIAEWRQQMLAAGIKTPVLLEELENHLREDVEQQMRSGVEAQRAFEMAAHRIGPASELKGEFQKIQTNQPMKQHTKYILRNILVVIAVIAIEVGFILPELARRRAQHETLSVWGMVFSLIVFAAFTFGAAWLSIGGLKSLERRLKG